MNRYTIGLVAAVSIGISALIIAASAPSTPEQLAQRQAASVRLMVDAKAASARQAEVDAQAQSKKLEELQTYFNALKKTAVEESYDTLARHPAEHIGEIVSFHGRVVQAVWSDTGAVFRIATSVNQWNDIVYVEHWTMGRPQERILENDVVDFWGKFAGIESYSAVLGNTVQIPHIQAAEVVRSKNH